MRLEGKTAIVTGAAGGIGRAICELFAQEGAHVFATDIMAAEFLDERIVFRPHDVTREGDWKNLVSEVRAERGSLSVLVNNAGIVGPYESIDSVDLEDYDRVIAVNQTGVFLGIRTTVGLMKEGGAGSIVNVSSTFGVVGVASLGPYQASKGAVRCMSKNAAVTYAPAIRVNSVHPGLTWTPMIESQDPRLQNAQIAMTPLGRVGQAKEIAYAVLFLASDEASYVTGAELMVDGGYTAN